MQLNQISKLINNLITNIKFEYKLEIRGDKARIENSGNIITLL